MLGWLPHGVRLLSSKSTVIKCKYSIVLSINPSFASEMLHAMFTVTDVNMPFKCHSVLKVMIDFDMAVVTFDPYSSGSYSASDIVCFDGFFNSFSEC